MTVTGAGNDFTELRVDDRQRSARTVLRAAIATHGDVLRFEVADPSLEDVFVQRIGALDNEPNGRYAAAEEAVA